MLNWNLQELRVTRPIERLLLVSLLGIFLIEGTVALLHMSATGDETHYLGMGRYLIKNQKWDLDDAVLQPPLSFYLHSIPLLAIQINDRLFEISDINARGRALMDSYPDDRVLMLARVPMLLLATGLGFLVFYWGKQAYGSAGGLLALFLYVFHPIIIANAVQIIPDLCLASFSTLTMYLFWRYRNSPRFTHSWMVGGALGLTLLSKYSAILVAIALALLTVLPAVIRRFGKESLSSSWRLRHLVLIFLAALLVMNAGYLFHGSFLPLEGNAFHSGLFQKLESVRILRNIPLPIPHAYVMGMDWQYSVIEDGFVSYLLGKRSQKGWFYFYLVAFCLKTPAAFILLLLLTAWKGHDRLQWTILAPAIVFPFYFSAIRLSRGIRYLLPIYPLLCVWIGQLGTSVKIRQTRSAMKLAILLLMVWYAASSIRISPHYLAYFNEIGGGPTNGINLLFESDFDWGQEMKGLSAYLRENKLDRIKLACFSTANPAHYGIKYEPLPCETPQKPETGLIAASATVLQVWGCYDWLKNYSPVDTIGYTIFIYDIPSPVTGKN
jgi:hypothetical protein